MATIEIQCNAKLRGHIVLATQHDMSFPPIRWQLANGDNVSVAIELSDKALGEIKALYQEHSSTGNWYVNSRVEALKIGVRVENVSEDDLGRLYGTHSSAPTFVAHSEKYQEARELGQRIVKDIHEGGERSPSVCS